MSRTRWDTRVMRLAQQCEAPHEFPPWTPTPWTTWTDREQVEALCAVTHLGDDLTHASAVLKACAS